MTQAQLLWDCRCELGEGTVWQADDQSIYFVDIKKREVLACTPATGRQRRWAVPHPVGWLVPRRVGGWLAGFDQGVAALHLHDDGGTAFEWLHRLHDAGSPLRLNDAKADTQGRLWFGSMNDIDMSKRDGVFYRLDRASANAAVPVPVPVDSGYGVTNGPTFSADGRTLYHTDSVAATIYAFDVSADGGLSNKRVWCRFAAGEGFPDGMTADAEGFVWVAHWGGARVTRRDASGSIVLTIHVDAPQVTNVAFGGADLSDLFITSARTGLDAAALEASPHAGALFVLPGAGRGRATAHYDG